MKRQASLLAQYLQNRMGDSLRAVGFYSANNIEMTYVRDDLVGSYSEDILDGFINNSKEIKHSLQLIDEGMGEPDSSLHVLSEGLVIQFHFSTNDLIFFTMERKVGQDFTQFIDDCREQMSQ